jgi:small subunit ribosomal protein S15
MLNIKVKNELITKYRLSSSDTGSPEVQASLLTARIQNLQNHFHSHKQDHHSRYGLLKLISRRRKLLNYLRYKNFGRYRLLIKNLGLRK